MHHWIAPTLAALALILAESAESLGQEAPDSLAPAPEVRPAEPIPTDSLAFIAPDSVAILAPRFLTTDAAAELAAVPGEDALPKNPRNAAIRAFLIPGWGQFYTDHPWRGVGFAAAEVSLLSGALVMNQRAKDLEGEINDLRDDFINSFPPDSIPEDPDFEFELLPEVIALNRELEQTKDRREDFFAWFAAAVIFAAVDAYVAAQLDPIRIGAEPNGRISAGVTLPVGPDPDKRGADP